MFWLIAFMTSIIVSTLVAGWYFERHPHATQPMKTMLGVNGLAMVGGLLALAGLGVPEVMAAASAVEEASQPMTLGMGLAILGVGLPTAASTIAAALAIGPIGSAALAVIAEKPEAFGRALIIIGLAEGIAIYGLVLSILLLDKL